MSRLSAALLLHGAILLGGSSALAQSDSDVYNRIEELHGDAAGFDRPLRQLVKAMRSGEAETIAGLAEYPLTVKANNETYDVENAEDFIDNFDDLVTPQTRRAVGRQQYKDLFVRVTFHDPFGKAYSIHVRKVHIKDKQVKRFFL